MIEKMKWICLIILFLLVPVLTSCFDSTPPPAITGLSVTARSGEVTLKWNQSDADDFHHYNVYLSRAEISDAGRNKPVAKIKDIETTTYTVTGLYDGTLYHFAVTAVDSSRNQSSITNDIAGVPAPALVPGEGRVILDIPDLPQQVLIRHIKDEFLIGVGTWFGDWTPTEMLYYLRANGMNYFLPMPSWGLVEVSPGEYTGEICPGEDFIKGAPENGAVLNGHCLVYLDDTRILIPEYAVGRPYKEQIASIERFILHTVSRYPEITIWTLNEPLIGNGLGWSAEENYQFYVAASKWIRQANPEAKVMINIVPRATNRPEYHYDPKTVLDELIKRGAVVDIIGIQLYPKMVEPDRRDESGYPSKGWVKDTIALYSTYNLPIIFSEVGVSGKVDNDELWIEQADWVEWFFRLCHDEPNVIGAAWYFVHDTSFIPYPGLANDDDSLRPVGSRLLELANLWNPAYINRLDGSAFIDLEPGTYDIIAGESTFRVVVAAGELVTVSSDER